ncbi:hypothetical protein JJB09_08390 [Rhizobium sp. KVB221]|uniref:Uncharacterized protein n=1 Tax=Rhizobium setariae TaxID=2801340 RepID=A0A936YTA9_9HYPH|nr:hypothetical protein [Rhizobium setariae]MBL0372045.1 hypothetical protein [Rhizobium setariae]
MVCLSISAVAMASDKKPVNPFDEPMVFAIVRSNAGFCEPNCPEWIYAEGQIDAKTPSRLRKVLKQAGERNLPLLIVSPGGNVHAAIEMGRIVRKRKMVVQVGFTGFAGCRPRDQGCRGDGPLPGEFRGMALVQGAFCWSACPLVLAGGVRRLSDPASMTGVHQVTTVYQREKVFYRERFRVVNGERKLVSRKIVNRKKAGTKVTTTLPKSTRKLLTAYFRDMGIDRVLLDAMLSTPPDKIRRLSPDEMLKMRLVTEVTAGDLVVDPQVCGQKGAPDYCIMRNPAPRTVVTAQAPPVQN